jgi:signal peptidase II
MQKRKYLILISILGFLVSLDQLTKIFISDNFRLGQSKVIIQDFFNLTLVHNPGAAFGAFATMDQSIREPFFLAVPILTLLGILFYFHKHPNDKILGILALSCIVGGAVGNLIDRMHLGYVVDFLDFHWKEVYHFPAFNVADSAITIGVGLLILDILLDGMHAKRGAKG